MYGWGGVTSLWPLRFTVREGVREQSGRRRRFVVPWRGKRYRLVESGKKWKEHRNIYEIFIEDVVVYKLSEPLLFLIVVLDLEEVGSFESP